MTYCTRPLFCYSFVSYSRSPRPFFFFNDTATPEIYTLSLHDALPIYRRRAGPESLDTAGVLARLGTNLMKQNKAADAESVDRKSTRLNSSHANISYAVFCLKKKKKRN